MPHDATASPSDASAMPPFAADSDTNEETTTTTAEREQVRMQQLLVDQRAAFAITPMPSAEVRRSWLAALRDALKHHEAALIAAISADFGHRSAHETRLAEMVPSFEGIRHARSHLKGWMKPSKRHVSAAFQPASARVVYQPLGVVGIIVPWNYPLYLALGPLITALSAGNRVMIKMSEFTPATAAALRTMLADAFDEIQVAVVTGEADVAAAFSALPFDHLLFTGSTAVGKHVMRAAAENLTPVTLELGGKSPVIMSRELMADETQRREAASRLAFGKGMNAGQTCVAPDYVLCADDQVDDLVHALGDSFKRFYPHFAETADYSRIINQRQYDRLCEALNDALAKGATVIPLVAGPGWDDPALVEKRLMPPMALLNVTDDMQVMQDEIFGPLLPIVGLPAIENASAEAMKSKLLEGSADELAAAMAYVNARPRPLALYYFGHDKAQQQRVTEGTHAGGMCLNDTLLHVAQDDMPFGGIGPSGMGHYHGKEGFLTLSKAKGVFAKGRLNGAKLMYPPYADGVAGRAIHGLIRRLLMR